MMKRIVIVFLLVNLILSACKPVPKPTHTPSPTQLPTTAPTSTPTAIPTATPTNTPSPSVSSPEEAGKTFYEALKRGNFEKAVSMYSEYYLSLTGGTRESLRQYFEKSAFEGWKLLDYRIIESKMLNDQTALLHILTKEETNDEDKKAKTYDFWVALRKENGQWLINGSIVDDRFVNVNPQNVNGVIVQPVRVIRFVDGFKIVLRIENTNNKRCFWGFPEATTATVYFGELAFDVYVSKFVKIEPNRVYPNAYISTDKFLEIYPNRVILSQWRWADETFPELPDMQGETWSYSFDLQYEAPGQ
jgi:hypothetical protein